MFYETENYEIISKQADSEYGHIVRLTIQYKDHPQTCPVCDFPAEIPGKRKKGIKIHSNKEREILDYNEGKERVEKITLKYKKYLCKNPSCQHTFVSNGISDKTSHTSSFDDYMSMSVITGDEKCTLQQQKCMYGLSHTTISDIVHKYIEKLSPHYSPPGYECKYYLKSFIYQGKESYYLGAIDQYDQQMLLAFFGYSNDARKEMYDYFRFHWFDTYTEENFNFSSQHIELASDIDIELFSALSNFFIYSHFSSTPVLLKQWLNAFKYDSRDGLFNEKCKAIDKLYYLLSSLESDYERIYKWWKEQQEDIRKSLEKLWAIIKSNKDVFFESHVYEISGFALIDKMIDVYNGRNLPFAVMATRLIIFHCEEEFFTSTGEILNYDYIIDKKTGKKYREYKISTPPAILERHKVPNRLSNNEPLLFSDASFPSKQEDLQEYLSLLPFSPNDEQVEQALSGFTFPLSKKDEEIFFERLLSPYNSEQSNTVINKDDSSEDNLSFA